MKIYAITAALTVLLFPASLFAGLEDFCDAFPPNIRCVAVVSPASFPDRKKIEPVIAQLEAHNIRVKTGKYLFRAEGSNAKCASIEERRKDFMTAWLDPEVDLILCTRGGSGSEELLPLLDWEAMRGRPELKLVGFSNITALTSAMLSKGVGHPFAGPNLGRLPVITKESRESFRRGASGKTQLPIQLKALRPGDCEGGICAGHLTYLDKIHAMPQFRIPTAGRIIFIECINRTPEQMERHWKNLLKAGFFNDVRGVVFGDFSRITPQKAEALRRKFAGTLSCPVYYGFPYGHGKANHTLDFFGKAVIRRGILTVTPGIQAIKEERDMR